MKNVLWLIALLAGGAIGFYFGVGQSARTHAMMVAQNDVEAALADLRMSLAALERNDLAHSSRLQERTVESAFFQMGSIPPEQIAHFTCTDKDRRTIQAARKYIEAKPGVLDGQMRPIAMQGLGLCAANGAG